MKVFLTLLAATFILVGVITKSGHKECVAKVDGSCISRSEFLRTKKYLLHTLNTNSNKINQADLNKAVLHQLISRALLRVESEHLGLIVDKSSIAAEIAKIPAFHNKAGQFDKELFQRMLAANSITESELTEQIKNDMESNMVSSVLSPYQPSSDLVKEFHSYFTQQRQIELITVSNAPSPYKPTDEEVAEYYKQHDEKFTVPEARDVSYIPIKLERYTTQAKVPDKEKAEHDKIKRAEDDLAGGSNMQQVAKKYGWNMHTITGIRLTDNIDAPGCIKQTLPEIFSWEENRPSDALQCETNPNVRYIINADKIHAAHKKSLNAVKQQAEALVVTDRQKSTLHNAALIIYNNMRSGKKTQQQILADNPDVHIQTITVSRTGKTGLSPNLIKDIFDAHNKNTYTNMHQEPERSAFQFAIVKGIIQPAALGKTEVLKKQIADYMTANLHQALLSFLYKKYKVEIYDDAIGEG